MTLWFAMLLLQLQLVSGADPGFDQGGDPDRDRPKTAILGPQFCRILVLGPHFWWSGGARAPGPPPGSAPESTVDSSADEYINLCTTRAELFAQLCYIFIPRVQFPNMDCVLTSINSIKRISKSFSVMLSSLLFYFFHI